MRLIGALLLFVLGLTVEAQNLVPNPSFEIDTACPVVGLALIFAPPWTNPSGGTPDYFNPCATIISGNSVPQNSYGYQFAHTGKAYAGIGTYVSTWHNFREYMQVELNDSLLPNQDYCIGFYVCLGKNFQYATNGFSAYFSKFQVNQSTTLVLPYIPQFNYKGSVISDSVNWTLISGNFIAKGGEKYLLIGNFNNDANTDTALIKPSGVGWQEAGYYIDDVYVGSCDTTKPPIIRSSLLAPNIFTPNNDGQNDVFKIQQNNIQSLNCQIYDRWGGKVWELKNPDESWDGHNQTGMPCNDGGYFYVLDAAGEDGKTYHQTGFVELLR
jgi:gliding motility-associated-like protein